MSEFVSLAGMIRLCVWLRSSLRELIDAGERLIVFTDDDGAGAYSWYMDVWAHASENPFHAESEADLSCAPNRGDPANPLFIFNHQPNFVTVDFYDQGDVLAAVSDLNAR